MAIDALPRFAHCTLHERVNSICTRCFQTVANAENEPGLLKQELAHIEKCEGLNFAALTHPEFQNPRKQPQPIDSIWPSQSKLA
jgi:hypothetical protein